MLTPHAQEYLEAIYKLGGHDVAVHLSALAEHLDLSAASVNEMVRRLEEQGLVRYTPYHGVRLQRAGLCEALAVIRRHRLWERFLTDILGLSWDVVHAEACRLEHAASDQVTEKLAELLDNPERCPHGMPMPLPGCEIAPAQEAISLAKLEAGQRGVVAYIGREDPALLRHLEQLHIRPSTEIVVEQVAPFDGPLTVRVSDSTRIIGHNVASDVYIISGGA
jgi:DtxR family transcriptional regulator, Mn-dependent transcriptional regulator